MKRFLRQLIARSVAGAGYTVSGNHVFANADYAAISRGAFRASVSEQPGKHPARVVRAAELLHRTYAKPAQVLSFAGPDGRNEALERGYAQGTYSGD